MAVISETNVNPQSISIKELPLFYSETIEKVAGWADYIPVLGTFSAIARIQFIYLATLQMDAVFADKIAKAETFEEIKAVNLENTKQMGALKAHVLRMILACVPFLGTILVTNYDLFLAGNFQLPSYKV